MNYRFSLEELIPEPANEQALQADADVSAQLALLPEQDQAEVAGLETQMAELQAAGSTAGSIEQVAQLVKDTPVEQISQGVSEALNMAVEGMMQLHRLPYSGRAVVAVESYVGYPTTQVKAELALENFERVQLMLKTVWERILKIVANIAAWFKRVFSRQRVRNQLLKSRLARAQELIRTMRPKRYPMPPAQLLLPHQPPPAPMISAEEMIFDDTLVNTLSVNNHPINPHDMQRGWVIHAQQMIELQTSFLELEKTVLGKLDEAARYVQQGSDAFSKRLEEAVHAIQSSAAGKQTAGVGSGLHEVRLFFGGMSYYRTTWHADAQTKQSYSLDAKVSGSSQVQTKADLTGKGVQALNSTQVSSLALEVQAYLTDRSVMDEKRESYAQRLDSLHSRFTTLMNSTKYDDEVLKRSRALSTLLNTYMRFKVATQLHLRDYDDRILDAVSTYIEKSVGAWV